MHTVVVVRPPPLRYDDCDKLFTHRLILLAFPSTFFVPFSYHLFLFIEHLVSPLRLIPLTSPHPIRSLISCPSVTQTESSVARETDVLKSSIVELREKLSEVDKSLTGLTALVTDFMKATGHPVTEHTTELLRSINNVCGQKRNRNFDLAPQRSDLSILTPDNLSESHISGDEGEEEEGEDGIEDPDEGGESDDTDSMCDLLTLCKQEKEEHAEHNAEADFDNFLSFIADEEHTPHLTIEDECGPSSSHSSYHSVRIGAPIALSKHSSSSIPGTHSLHDNNHVRMAVSMRDIPCILASLAPNLQSRYLDKLAATTNKFSLVPPSRRGSEESRHEESMSEIKANIVQHQRMLAKLDEMATVFCPSEQASVPPSVCLSKIFNAN